MKIGFDISQTGSNKAGCGYFADSLILALTELDRENDYILYPHFGTTFWDPNAEKGTRKILKSNVKRIRIGKDLETAFSFWEDLPSDAEERLDNPHIIHANNYSCPKGFGNARVVYTLYDLSFFDYPDLTTEENRTKCFGGVFQAAVSADFILAISEYSRNRFLETYPHYPKERTGVVHLGSRFTSSAWNRISGKRVGRLVPDRFWLSVCTLEPRKNLRRLLRAFREYLAHTNNPIPLVLAGGKGWLEGDLEPFIDRLGLKEHVRLPGYVSDDELIWLYRNCFAFLYPSLYEGFGLPVLEALGFGAAVMAANTTSLPEVAGDAALYVNPLDQKEMAEGLLKIAGEEGYRKKQKGKASLQAKKFSWEKSGEKVLRVYEKVMAMAKFERNQDAFFF